MASREITSNTTLLSSDNGLELRANAIGDVTITIPTSVFSVGDYFLARSISAGDITITGDTGVTVNTVSAGSISSTLTYQLLRAELTGTDTWTVTGNVTDTVISEQNTVVDTGITDLTSPFVRSTEVDYGEAFTASTHSDYERSTLSSPTVAPLVLDGYNFGATSTVELNNNYTSTAITEIANFSFDYGDVALVVNQSSTGGVVTLQPAGIEPRLTPIIVLG